MPGHIIFTTVGTSALDRTKLEPLFLWDSYQRIRIELTSTDREKRQSWIANGPIPKRVDQFIDAYIDTLKRLDINEEVNKPPNGVNLFSGEMTSLHLMYENNEKYEDLLDLNMIDDTLSFLLSDSAEGVLCGMIHERILHQGIFRNTQDIHPKLSIIDGLKPDNLSEFLTLGANAFANVLGNSVKGETKTSILNVTGGFKSLVPFSTFYSLVFGIPIFFTFEDLPRLIRIKPPYIESEKDKSYLLGYIQNVLKESSDSLILPPMPI